jgi:hypothetical protein
LALGIFKVRNFDFEKQAQFRCCHLKYSRFYYNACSDLEKKRQTIWELLRSEVLT